MIHKQHELTFAYITEADLPDIVAMLAKESVCEHVFFGPNTEQKTRAYFEPRIDQSERLLRKENDQQSMFLRCEKTTCFSVNVRYSRSHSVQAII